MWTLVLHSELGLVVSGQMSVQSWIRPNPMEQLLGLCFFFSFGFCVIAVHVVWFALGNEFPPPLFLCLGHLSVILIAWQGWRVCLHSANILSVLVCYTDWHWIWFKSGWESSSQRNSVNSSNLQQALEPSVFQSSVNKLQNTGTEHFIWTWIIGIYR